MVKENEYAIAARHHMGLSEAEAHGDEHAQRLLNDVFTTPNPLF
jgi:hypothetical protein